MVQRNICVCERETDSFWLGSVFVDYFPITVHRSVFNCLCNFFFQSQLEAYRCENERLRAGETAALSSMRQNAQVASKYLIKAAQDAETSIKYVEKSNYCNWRSSKYDNQLKSIRFQAYDMMALMVCIFCPQAVADRKRDFVSCIRAAEFNWQDHWDPKITPFFKFHYVVP